MVAKLTPEEKIALAYAGRLDKIEKSHGLMSNSAVAKNRQSTGTLVLDLICGGGIVHGMYSMSGPEASGKTTLTMACLKATVKSSTRLLQHWDAENTALADPGYACRQLGVKRLEDIYGLKGKKGYIIPPKARYYDENILETFFDVTSELLSMLPNKVFLPEEEMYAYTFTRQKEQVALMNELGLKADKKLSQLYGKSVCLTEDPGLQAVVFMDSWPSLLQAQVDDESEASNAMAHDARAFSKHIKRVAGKLRRKYAAIWGVNQLREKPGVMYGSPEYEPGGNALKFYSSVRNVAKHRAVPEQWKSGNKSKTTAIYQEESIDGKLDSYQFKHIRNIKNKTGTPFLEGWTRVWIRDSKDQGHGIDPVFDTFEYLRMTGQLTGSRKSFKITLKGLEGVTFDWLGFKKLILADHWGKMDLAKEAMKSLKLKKPVRIRTKCFAQLADGSAMEMMAKASSAEFEEVNEDEDLEE